MLYSSCLVAVVFVGARDVEKLMLSVMWSMGLGPCSVVFRATSSEVTVEVATLNHWVAVDGVVLLVVLLVLAKGVYRGEDWVVGLYRKDSNEALSTIVS